MRALVPLHPQGWFVAGPEPDRYYVPAPDLSYSMGGSAFVHGPLGTPQGSATPAAPAGERLEVRRTRAGEGAGRRPT